MSILGERLNFDSQCRVCMCREPKMVNIFSSHTLSNNISITLMECVPVDISEEDTLPHTICELCLEKLENVFQFRTMCLNSDTTFRNRSVKEEKICLETTSPADNPPIHFDLKDDPNQTKQEDISDVPYGLDNESLYTDSEKEEPEHEKKKIKRKKLNIDLVKKEPYKRRRKRKSGPKKCPLIPDADGIFSCESCPKKYKRKQHLERHMILHSDFRFYCEICGREFVRVSNLQLHMKTHSNQRMYSCEFCGFTFRTRNVLRNHRTIHLDVRPFECSQCDKKFRQKKGLENHERTHTGERPFECETCGKCFNRKHHLVTHAQIHGERNFKCELCTQTFISKQNLHLHMSKH